MKSIILPYSIKILLVVVFLSSQILHAQTVPEKPNPRQIFERGIQALGERENLKSIFSKQIVGEVTRKSDGAKGTIEVLMRQPDCYYSRISFGDQFEQIGFNGLSGYQWTSGKETEILSGKELSSLESEALYRSSFWYQEKLDRPSKLRITSIALLTAGLSTVLNWEYARFIGTSSSQGKPTKTIAKILHGTYATLDFEDVNGLLMKENLGFNVDETREYDDFRKVNNILEPYSILITKGSQPICEIRISSIVHNLPLANDKFNLPPGAQKSLPGLESVIKSAAQNQEKVIRNYDRFTYEKLWKQTGTGTDEETGMSYDWTRSLEYEVSFYRGFIVQTPTTRNPRPFNFKEIILMGEIPASYKDKEAFRKKVYKKIDARNNRSKMNGSSSPTLEGLAEFGETWGYDLLRLLKESQFFNTRRETVNKHELIAVDFLTAANANRINQLPKQELLAGTLWIDPKSSFVAKTLIRRATPFLKNKIQEVYTFAIQTELEQNQFCDDFWLPVYRYDFGSETTLRFRNYKLDGSEILCDANRNSKLK